MRKFKIGDQVKVVCGCGCAADGKLVEIVGFADEEENLEAYTIRLPNGNICNGYMVEELEFLRHNRNGANT